MIIDMFLPLDAILTAPGDIITGHNPLKSSQKNNENTASAIAQQIPTISV